MAYIQKIVPLDVPMLQLERGYDVISYRIEHVKTAKNPIHYEEAEAEGLNLFVPDEYQNQYIIGMRIEPFVRIYRTIAPHEEVSLYLSSGKTRLELFKNKDINGAREESCYTTLEPHSFTGNEEVLTLTELLKEVMSNLEVSSTEIKDTPEGGKQEITHLERKKDPEEVEKEFRRKKYKEFRQLFAPKLKNLSNKFITKCYAIDDFLSDVMNDLADPKDLHRDKIMKRAALLDPIFELCKNLDSKLPDGFA